MSEVQYDTRPGHAPRRYSASGPIGFVEAVRHAARIAGIDAHFALQVPEGLMASAAITGDPKGVAEAQKASRPIPPTVVWEIEQRPALKKATGSAQHVNPIDQGFSSTPTGIHEDSPKNSSARHVTEPNAPPLWERAEDVPPHLQPFVVKDGKIDPDVLFEIDTYMWDSVVRFVVLGRSEQAVLRLGLEIQSLLLTMFHRRKMNSEVSGHQGPCYTGVRGALAGKVPPSVAAFTVTWHLRQTVSYAQVASTVKQVRLDVFGK